MHPIRALLEPDLRTMRFFLFWIAFPLLAAATLVLVDVRLSDVERPPGAAAFPGGPELSRMVEEIDAERRVDRPGLRIDLEMSDEVLAAFEDSDSIKRRPESRSTGGHPSAPCCAFGVRA